jgi:DUF917 family protein
MRIDVAHVPALELGVALLGSGGGGDTRTGAMLLRQRLAAGSAVALLAAAELPPGGLVMPVGVVGATAVFQEKLPGGQEYVNAVRAVQRWTGLRADALMSIEVGGLNGMTAMVAATDLGLPVVDADLSGRGLPRLDQVSTAAAGRSLVPCALTEPGGQVLLLDGVDAAGVERTVRSVLAGAGGWAAMAFPPVPARELADCVVLGSISAALRLGVKVGALGENPRHDQLAEASGGRVLGGGRVIEVNRYGGAGAFGRGSVTVEDHRSGALIRLEMENEYLLASVDGAVVASTPDILSVVDHRTVRPVSCDQLRRGTEVDLLQLPAPAFWTDPARRDWVAPVAFGIDHAPVLM